MLRIVCVCCAAHLLECMRSSIDIRRAAAAAVSTAVENIMINFMRCVPERMKTSEEKKEVKRKQGLVLQIIRASSGGKVINRWQGGKVM